jgi:chromatin segregation and condensation protein Rec8/ScpA/Scc1 (kleisin family)
MGFEDPHFESKTERLSPEEQEKLNSPNKEVIEKLDKVRDYKELTDALQPLLKDGKFVPKQPDEMSAYVREIMPENKLFEKLSRFIKGETDELRLPLMGDQTLADGIQNAAERLRKLRN